MVGDDGVDDTREASRASRGDTKDSTDNPT